MVRLIILVAVLANISYVLTVPTSDDAVYYENSATSTDSSSSDYNSSSSSSSTSSSSSSLSSSSTFSSDVSSSEVEQCEDEDKDNNPPSTTPTNPDSNPPSTTPTNPDSNPPSTTPTNPNTTPGSGSTSNAIDNFDKGNSMFTANFFNNVVKANPGKSVIMSPYSTLFLLAVLALRATQGSACKEQLMNALNFKNDNEITSAIPAILDSINHQENITLSLAAKVYGNDKSKFSDIFRSETKEVIDADSETLDFSNPKQAADIINAWVASKTNNKIKDLIPEDLLKPDTELVLANALYFLGEWRYKFDKGSTYSSDFYTADDNTIKVDTMHQTKFFQYAELENLNAQALELPYVNSNLTCLIILPREKTGAASLVAKLAEDNSLSSIRSSLSSARVAVSLPKFETTTSTDLKDIFIKLGISAIFDAEQSTLSNILDDPRIRILVTAAIQKATVILNETGSEAAAANAIIGVGITSVPIDPPIDFNADRSFLYYFLFQGNPIFCGLFTGKQ